MSDTPRTDMFCRTVDHTTFVGGKIYQATIETVDASFARQLEKELAEAQAEIDALRMGKMSPCDYYTSKESEENLCRELAEARAEIEQMRELLLDMLKKPQLEVWRLEAKIRAALSAAERGE